MSPPLSSRKVRLLVARLAEVVPTDLPVRVFNESHEQWWAGCQRLTAYYKIMLDPALRQPAYTWGLIHEYAHAACWDIMERWREHREHPPEFWLTHGRCYDALIPPIGDGRFP